MVSQEEMANAYLLQLRDQVERARAQLAALEQHLKECDEEIANAESNPPTD